MSSYDSTQAYDLFTRLQGLPDEDRACELARVSSPIADHARALLAAYDATATSVPALKNVAVEVATSIGIQKGDQIGGYVIEKEIGEGTTGIVYQARQEAPIRRTVAIKVIKPGLNTRQVLSRFETERQAMAQMTSEHIAKIFDAGATPAGLAYFVMELVEGKPLTEHADEHRMSLRSRLELFMEVCDAITHAHQKAVIHRDLKSGNVMASYDASKGAHIVKVIDFGMAKSISGGQRINPSQSLTNWGGSLGTPATMSPEQFKGEPVDTLTDVYSLGATLFQLLVGHYPFPETVDEYQYRASVIDSDPPSASRRYAELSGDAQGVISEARGMTPEAMRKALRGDLNSVIAKAIKRQKDQRYQSAKELRDDIQHYLDGKPVSAKPDSTGYRLKKFAERHQGTLIAACAVGVMITSLLAVWAYTSSRYQRRIEAALSEAVKQKNEAEIKRGQADATLKFVTDDLLSNLTPDTIENWYIRDKVVKQLIDIAADRVGRRFGHQPLVEASIQHLLGSAYLSVGEYASALQQFDRAWHTRKAKLSETDPDILLSKKGIAASLHGLGRHEEALALAKHCFEELSRVIFEDEGESIDVMAVYAIALLANAKFAESIAMQKQVVERRAKMHGEDSPQAVQAELRLVSMLGEVGDVSAVALQKRAIERSERLFGTEHRVTMAARAELAAMLLMVTGNEEEAERLLRQRLEFATQQSGAGSPAEFIAKNNLAHALIRRGKAEEAERILADALHQVAEEERFAEASFRFYLMANLGKARASLGKLEEAERLQGQAIERLTEVEAKGGIRVAQSLSRAQLLEEYAETLLKLGDYQKAEEFSRKAFAIQRQLLSPNQPALYTMMDNHAGLLFRVGSSADSIRLSLEAIEGFKRTLGPSHIDTLIATANYLERLLAGKHYSEAGVTSLAQEALALATAPGGLGRDHPLTKMLVAQCAAFLYHSGESTAAHALLKQYGYLNGIAAAPGAIPESPSRLFETSPSTQPARGVYLQTTGDSEVGWGETGPSSPPATTQPLP